MIDNRSYVSRETNVCPVCGRPFETGSILLNKRLRNTLEPTTITGMSLCPDDKDLHQKGFIAPNRVTKPYLHLHNKTNLIYPLPANTKLSCI